MTHDTPEVVADAPLDPFADPARGAGSPLGDPDALGADGKPRRTHQQPEHTQETADQRARRCPFHKVCVCDHTVCRDGWLDEVRLCLGPRMRPQRCKPFQAGAGDRRAVKVRPPR